MEEIPAEPVTSQFGGFVRNYWLDLGVATCAEQAHNNYYSTLLEAAHARVAAGFDTGRDRDLFRDLSRSVVCIDAVGSWLVEVIAARRSLVGSWNSREC